MIKTTCFFFTLICISFFCKSQNLSGTWEGSGAGTPYWRISIVHIGDSCYGYSYDAGPGHCKANFIASFNAKENKFKGKTVSFIERTFGHELFTCNLHYRKDGGAEYLRGGMRPKSVVGQIFSLGIGMPGELRKISSTIDTTAFMQAAINLLAKNNTDSIPNPVAIIADDTVTAKEPALNDSTSLKIFADSVIAIKDSRKSVIQKTITTYADTVKIILYDDGEIDGDIVTIFDNGKLLANKLMLTKEPFQIIMPLPADSAKHTIELMAENEGSIPPNPAYMLVLAGDERVEVKASSDKLSNAAIVIQKQE